MRLSGVARAEALLMASNAVYQRFVWAASLFLVLFA
jgi:hypothetical protein